MPPLFRKLNLGLHTTLVVLNSPSSFDTELDALSDCKILKAIPRKDKVSFAIAFAITQAELDKLSEKIAQATEGDAIVWIAYPKGTSKNYRCEFNRDSGWQVLGAAGFEPVRQVAIDTDWSALRFRRTAYIKTLNRSSAMALSDEGKRRTKKSSSEKNG